MLIQRLRNSQRIVCAAFAADAIGILPAVFESPSNLTAEIPPAAPIGCGRAKCANASAC